MLSTDDIANEGRQGGYNSSIMLWDAGDDRSSASELLPVYECLRAHQDAVGMVVHRFDHWLEMMVDGADFVQQMYPGQIVDFRKECTENVPEGARIVCFPLDPKPHTCGAPWVRDAWGE